MSIRRCPFCNRRQLVRHDVDLAGQAYEIVEPCLHCPDGRRVAGICRDCPRPVTGRPGIALRCDGCRKAEARAASRRWKKKHPERYAESQAREARRRREDPEVRARRRQYEREQRAKAEYRKRRKERRRRISLAHPERNQERHRRYRERYPERVKEQQRRANEKRREQMREYMHRYATKYVGPGKLPVCECGSEIPFGGLGRPHKRCPECDPKAWGRDQSRREAA